MFKGGMVGIKIKGALRSLDLIYSNPPRDDPRGGQAIARGRKTNFYSALSALSGVAARSELNG